MQCVKTPVSSPCRKMAIFSNISVHNSLISGSAGSTASSAVSTPPSPENNQKQGKYNTEYSLSIRFEIIHNEKRKAKCKGYTQVRKSTMMVNNITHTKKKNVYGTLALASYRSCKVTSLTVCVGSFGNDGWAFCHSLRAFPVSAGACSRVQSC